MLYTNIDGIQDAAELLKNTKQFLRGLKEKLPTTTVETVTVSNGKTASTITSENGKKATVKESPSETSTITLSNGNRITCRL
uniref:Uncharacterized protein n=1 Tax=Trichobilharzia regenti TaxID=157069 RepID=A0AA85J5H9_TRIRE|nr:unnamed protein product [Trichobilharzia regenti]